MLILSTIAALCFCWFLTYIKPTIGLIVSLLTALLFFSVGEFFEDVGMVLLSPGIFLLPFVYVAFVRPTEDYSAVRNAARAVLYVCIGIGALFGIGYMFGLWVMFGVLLIVLWGVAVLLYWITSRWSTAFCVLSTLGAGVRQNLPLPMALDSAAQGRSDYEGFVYRQIKRWLVQGHSLTEAIKLGFPRCPAHAVGLLAAAEQVNRLPQGFQAVEKNVMIKAHQKQSIMPFHPLYPVMMLFIISFIVTGLLKFVIPQFESVLREIMDSPLPKPTQWLIGFWQDRWDVALLTLTVVTGLAVFIFAFRQVRGSCKFRRSVLSVMYDWLVWHIPVLHWFARSFGLVQLTETLHLSLQTGCPVDQAVGQCLHLDLNHCFRKRVRAWHRKITQGEPIAESAQQCGLGRPLAWAFDEQVNQGNTLNVLNMLETYYYNLLAYHSNLARLILAPCIILGLAAIVGFIAVAFFSPLVSVIHHLVDICP